MDQSQGGRRYATARKKRTQISALSSEKLPDVRGEGKKVVWRPVKPTRKLGSSQRKEGKSCKWGALKKKVQKSESLTDHEKPFWSQQIFWSENPKTYSHLSSKPQKRRKRAKGLESRGERWGGTEFGGEVTK